MELNQLVELIRSREDFAAFVRALLRDYNENLGSWQNSDLQMFLEGVAGWVEDMEGYFQNKNEVIPEPPNWSLFGKVLLAARVYE